MPQTAASARDRLEALRRLVHTRPKIAWQICIDQWDIHRRTGEYGQKPRWRPEARGLGEPTIDEDARNFRRAALRLAIDWPTHTRDTLGDLVRVIGTLPTGEQSDVWEQVEIWAHHASEADRAWMWERVRTGALTRHTGGSDHAKELVARARRVRERLEPKDVVLRHQWLFERSWVDESADEANDDQPDFDSREQRIAALRAAAVRDVYSAAGVNGLRRLARVGDGARLVAWALFQREAVAPQLGQVVRAIAGDPLRIDEIWVQRLLSGALHAASQDSRGELMTDLTRGLSPELTADVLALGPVDPTTWNHAASCSKEIETRYWASVQPSWIPAADDRDFAIERLIEAGRPTAAFELTTPALEATAPRLLARILLAMTASQEAAESRRLDGLHIRQALAYLNRCQELSDDELASLELHYIAAFMGESDRTHELAIERQLDQHPEWFVQALQLLYRPDDDASRSSSDASPPSDGDVAARRRALQFLDTVSWVPGHCKKGGKRLDAARIAAWIEAVRAGCRTSGLTEIGDIKIGEMYAKAPMGDDGVWPHPEVRTALDQCMSDALGRGLRVGLYNSRGGTWAGEGGHHHRALAGQYEAWATAMRITHPKLASVLRQFSTEYRQEARYWDHEAVARDRRI